MHKKLGFGCMRLPLTDPDDCRAIDTAELSRMVDEFLSRGFDCFDVAATYHDGCCEAAMRHALTERHPRTSYRLCDKLPTMQVENAAQQEDIFRRQLERCGVEHFDRYLVHCATEEFFARAEALESFRFVLRKRDEGLAGEAGFSFHGSPELLERILTEYPQMDFVQLQINYVDWELTPVAARRCYETARRHGKPVVAMCSQKGGLLASIPPSAERLLRAVNPGQSPSEWALRFAASPHGVDTVLSGMSSLREVRQNCQAMENPQPLDAFEIETLARAAAAIVDTAPVQCTSCGYCTAACPAGIPIPDYLSLYNSEIESRRTGSGSRRDRRGVCSSGRGAASSCTACGACERTCPQRLGIIDPLRRISKMFETEAGAPAAV